LQSPDHWLSFDTGHRSAASTILRRRRATRLI